MYGNIKSSRNLYSQYTVEYKKYKKERKIKHLRGLKDLLMAEKARLEESISISKISLKDAPNGTLRLSQSNNYLQFYHCTEENKLGKYITKGNDELIRKLAQKSYDEKLLRVAEKRLNQIKRILKDYEDNEIEQIFLKEHKERQRIIHPVEPTWEHRLKEWKIKEYQGKGFGDEMPMIVTERGERVRSKSEKIMADYFHRHGIEYKYECPIYLKGMGMVYPDFTFLSKKLEKEVYWEHCGMVDEPSYARSLVRKIEAYENNGIFPGERLILTYETEQSILNTGKIEQMVNRYLI